MFERLESSIVKELDFKFTSVKNGQTTTRTRGTSTVKDCILLGIYERKIGGFIRLKPCFSDHY